MTEEKKVPEKIEELDRARLSEVRNEIVAVQNALTALETKQLQLDAEKRNAELQAQLQLMNGQQLEKQLEKQLQEIYSKYGIPTDYSVNAKTGDVTAPANGDSTPQLAVKEAAPGGAPSVPVHPVGSAS